MLPSITNVINLADSHDRAAFAMVTHVKQEPRERENSESKEEVMSRFRATPFYGRMSFLQFCISLRFFLEQEQYIKAHICLKALNVGPMLN